GRHDQRRTFAIYGVDAAGAQLFGEVALNFVAVVSEVAAALADYRSQAFAFGQTAGVDRGAAALARGDSDARIGEYAASRRRSGRRSLPSIKHNRVRSATVGVNVFRNLDIVLGGYDEHLAGVVDADDFVQLGAIERNFGQPADGQACLIAETHIARSAGNLTYPVAGVVKVETPSRQCQACGADAALGRILGRLAAHVQEDVAGCGQLFIDRQIAVGADA